MSTFMAGARQAAASRRWHIIDAEGQVLGRIATIAARLLQGKHKAIYTPYLDTGDHVVVVNAAKVKLTGRKEDQKIYRQHSGYEGGLREERARLAKAAFIPAVLTVDLLIFLAARELHLRGVDDDDMVPG